MAVRGTCEDHQAALSVLRNKQKEYETHVMEYSKSGVIDVARIETLKDLMEGLLQSEWKEIDPHQVELRRKLMKKLGLKELPDEFIEGWAAVSIDSRTRLINQEGEFFHTKFNKDYDIIGNFSEGFALAWDEDTKRSLFIGTNGEYIGLARDPNSRNTFFFQTESSFQEGFAAVKLVGTEDTVFIDKNGLILSSSWSGELVKLKQARDFHEGKAGAHFSVGFWGYVTKEGNTTTREYNLHAGDFHEGRAWVRTGDEAAAKQFLLVNEDGEPVKDMKTRYTNGLPCSEGLIAAESSIGVWQFLDKNGNLAIQDLYEGISLFGFKEGKCGVKIDGEWLFIDKQGNELFGGERFENIANDFIEGRCIVRTQTGEAYLINEKGQKILGPYKNIGYDSGGLLSAQYLGENESHVIDQFGRDVYRNED